MTPTSIRKTMEKELASRKIELVHYVGPTGKTLASERGEVVLVHVVMRLRPHMGLRLDEWEVLPSGRRAIWRRTVKSDLSELEVLSLARPNDVGDALANPVPPLPNAEVAADIIRSEHRGRWGRAVKMERLLRQHMSMAGHPAHDSAGSWYWEVLSVVPEDSSGSGQVYYQTTWRVNEAEGRAYLHATKDLSDLEVLALMTKENPASKELAVLTKDNPRSLEVYDPREEQLRAQRQAIYETQVLRALGRKAPFRDRSGRRADLALSDSARSELVRRAMFAMGTSVQQRDRRLYPGSQQFSPKTARESANRYADPVKLFLNRQDYEETLGLARKSGFYRVTMEPTKTGLGYFVWPLPPGAYEPVQARDESTAREIAGYLNHHEDPRQTGRWWRPNAANVSRAALEHWLPPGAVFRPTFKMGDIGRPRRSRRKRA